jgi:Tol biopolymer transport system component
MHRAGLLLVGLVLVGLVGPVQGQAPAALVGPLIAVNSAAQDALYLYDLGNSSLRTLRFGTGWHAVWGFTEGGCRVLYTLSAGPALGRLYSARLDGSDPRPLVQFDELPEADWGVWEPQATPDGTRVAFVMIRREYATDGSSGLTHHIAWVPATGGAPTFYSVTGDEHEPEWSPDGAWLAYISYSERLPGADPLATAAPTPEGAAPFTGTLVREADLWVVSTDATIKYNLTDFPVGSVRGPRWRGDSQLLTFIYAPTPGNDQFWMTANTQGAISAQLSQNYTLILDSTWFPDGTAILGTARGLRGVEQNLLWRVPLVGLADTDSIRYGDQPQLDYADYPRFSPDGRWLAARSDYRLTLMDVTSGVWSALPIPPGNTPPAWSPAGFSGEAGC